MLKDYFKKFNAWALILFLGLSLFAVSCSEDDTSTSPNNSETQESQILLDYLESNGDFINTAAPAIVKATDVHTDLITNKNFYLIDIRAENDFNAGHIEGAHNVALADLLNHVESINASDYEKIVIICYSGQTAAYGACLLRLMGYNNVYSMKWGMSSWNSQFADKWLSKLSNAKATMLEKTANNLPEKGSLPTINTGKSTAEEILEARVNTLLTEGYSVAKISNSEVFDNSSNYFIINYWPEAQYLDPGHIPGAVQFTPKSGFKSSENLLTIPTDKEVVVYCYTGQTSSYVAAYLRLLGYNAKSLLYGANGFMYDEMASREGFAVFKEETEVHDYEYVTE